MGFCKLESKKNKYYVKLFSFCRSYDDNYHSMSVYTPYNFIFERNKPYSHSKNTSYKQTQFYS